MADGLANTVQELISVLSELDPNSEIRIRVIDAGCGCCAGEDQYEQIAIERHGKYYALV